MGGRVTVLAFESPSTSRNIDFGPFLTFFDVSFEEKNPKSNPRIENFHEGVHGSKNLKRLFGARDLFH